VFGFLECDIGLPCYLYLVPFFYKISNLGDTVLQRFKYSVASGTFCVKLRATKREKLIKIKMPSTIIKFFPRKYICILNKNKQHSKKKFNPGKAGYYFLGGFKPCVRGVAMNAVDHPNGGRTKSCSPEKSP
jgi:ribosomal protein L2